MLLLFCENSQNCLSLSLIVFVDVDVDVVCLDCFTLMSVGTDDYDRFNVTLIHVNVMVDTELWHTL